MSEEEAPFDVMPLVGTEDLCQVFDSAIPLDEWESLCRRYESNATDAHSVERPDSAVCGCWTPVLALMQAIRANDDAEYEERRYKVRGLHVGGVKLRSGEKRNTWDGERSKLTANQWLVATGMGKVGKKSRPLQSKLLHDIVWTLSSRIMADMRLRPMRNPDVKIPNQ